MSQSSPRPGTSMNEDDDEVVIVFEKIATMDTSKSSSDADDIQIVAEIKIIKEDCPVCLEDITREFKADQDGGDFVEEETGNWSCPNCSKSLHRHCIVGWIQKSGSCGIGRCPWCSKFIYVRE